LVMGHCGKQQALDSGEFSALCYVYCAVMVGLVAAEEHHAVVNEGCE